MGIVLAREPWLAPEDSFRELRNMRLWNGRIQKRPGAEVFSEIGIYNLQQIATGNGTTRVFYGTLPHDWLIRKGALGGSYKLRFYSGSGASYQELSIAEKLVDAPTYSLQGDGSGSVQPSTGYYWIAFNTAPASGEPVYAEYYYSTYSSTSVTGEVVGQVTSDSGRFQLANTWIAPGTLTLTTSFQTITDDGRGGLNGAVGGVDYETGLVVVFTGLSTSVGEMLTASYSYRTRPSIVWLETVRSKEAGEVLLASDGQWLYRYNQTQGVFARNSTQLFTIGGADDPIFSALGVDQTSGFDVVYLVNGKDPVRKFDPVNDTITSVSYAIGSNTLDSARYVATYRGSLVFVGTTESGTLYPRRIRYTLPYQHDTLREFDYIDLPTQDDPTSIRTWREEAIITCTREIWVMEPGDFRIPFVVKRAAKNDGCIAPRSVIATDLGVIMMSRTGPVVFDGQQVQSLTATIPDFVQRVDPTLASKAWGVFARELQEILIGYVRAGSSTTDKIFAMSVRDRTVFEYEMLAFASTQYRSDYEPLVDDIDAVVDSIEYAADAPIWRGGFPITLVGTTNGRVLRLPSNVNYTDDGASYTAVLETQGLNPFVRGDTPQLARLGYLQLYADAMPGTSITVKFYIDDHESPWKTVTVPMDAVTSGNMKTLVTIAVNKTAMQHRIRIEDSSDDLLAIDAIIPWFEPDGELRPR